MNLVMSEVLPTDCSPRKTNLNFLSGFPKSPEVDMVVVGPGRKSGRGCVRPRASLTGCPSWLSEKTARPRGRTPLSLRQSLVSPRMRARVNRIVG